MLRIIKLKAQGFRNFVWRYDGIFVQARTKSEARAKLKNIVAVDRLPAGAIVELRAGITE